MRSLKTIIAATSAGFLLLSSCGEKKQNSRSQSESGDAGKVSVIAAHLPEGVDVQSVTVDPVANRASLVEAFGESGVPKSPPDAVVVVTNANKNSSDSTDTFTVVIAGRHYSFAVRDFKQFPSTISFFSDGSTSTSAALRLGDGGNNFFCRLGICIFEGGGICAQVLTKACQYNALTGLIDFLTFASGCLPSGWSKSDEQCKRDKELKERADTSQRGDGHTRSDPAGGAPATGAPATGAPATGAPATGAPATGAPATGAPAGGAPVVDPPNALPEKGEGDPNCTCQCSIRQTVGAEPDCFWASLTGSGATGGCNKTGRCSQSDQFSLKPENTPPPPSAPVGVSDSSAGCECQIVSFTMKWPDPGVSCTWVQKTLTFEKDTPTCQKPKLGTWCACPDSNSAATSGGDNSATTASAPPPASSGVCERCGDFCCVDKVVSDTDQCGKIGDPNVSSPTLGGEFTCGPRGGDVTGGGGTGTNPPIPMKSSIVPDTM